MSSAVAAGRGLKAVPSSSSESSAHSGGLDYEDAEEDIEFHDCTEMDTLYLSFDAQDLAPPPLRFDIPADDSDNAVFSDSQEDYPHSRSESDAFYSCEGRLVESEEEPVTSDPDTIDYPSPVEEPAQEPETSSFVKEDPTETTVEWRRRCRKAFAPQELELSTGEAPSERTTSAEDPSDVQSIEMSSVPTCTAAESFNKEEKTSGIAEQSSAPDMLVTLTSTEMGISAKREDSLEPNLLASRTLDSLPDNTIFDKARLVEEALDTADINKCMAARTEARLSALPGLRVQEQYSDELRSITKSNRHHSSSSSVAHICPSLPVYRMEAVHAQSALVRAHSAPMEMKEGSIMAEDAEISSILGHGTCFSAAEDRPLSSLSEPFEEVIQTSQHGCKKCLTSWVQRKMHFVSFDTESDAASVTRSEYIMDLKRGKERRDDDDDERCVHHSSRPSSSLRYANGFVIGPSVSPVPPGGIQDFSKEDAVALNAVLRNDPQLRYVHMGEWTR